MSVKKGLKLFALFVVLITVFISFTGKVNAAENKFNVYYHIDEAGKTSSKTTPVTYGKAAKTLKTTDLGFSKPGKTFAGWKVYRDIDDKWYMSDASGNCSFKKLEKGKPPAGFKYELYKEGAGVSKTAIGGGVHFYGTWKDAGFKVYYHPEEGGKASSKTTPVTYGKAVKTLKTTDLGFSKPGKTFAGWKVYRDVDDKWYVSDTSGNCSFKKLEKGKLPAGFKYELYKEGAGVSKTAVGGGVHFYGTWKDTEFKVYYHLDEGSKASSKTTRVIYGKAQKTLKLNELGFSKGKETFAGWKVYRDADDKWYVSDEKGVCSFRKLSNGILPAGYKFEFYREGASVAKTASGGGVHFYGIWGINVTDHGADGSDKLDDWKAIQSCLNIARDTDDSVTIRIPAGKYYISNNLMIFSNTNLVLDDKAEIIRTDQNKSMLIGEADASAGSYDQCKNVTVTGGIWNGNGSSDKASKALMKFQHGENIILKDCTIRNMCSRHMVGFSGIKNLTVRNVTFKDQYIYTGNDKGKGSAYEENIQDENFVAMEALHIDYISSDGRSEPGSQPWDDTVNQNIHVENCYFENVISGVGSHYVVPDAPVSRGIHIVNNKFTNIGNTGIHVCNYSDALVEKNVMNACGEGIRFNNSGGVVRNNDILIDAAEVIRVNADTADNLFGMVIYDNSNIDLSGNKVSNAVKTGIAVVDSKAGLISGNTVIKSGEYGISLNNAAADSFSGNLIDNTGLDGIHLSKSKARLEGNEIRNNKNAGINIAKSSYDVRVEKNIIVNPGEYGIAVNESSAEVLGNDVLSSKTAGIVFKNAKASKADANIVKESGSFGVIVNNGSELISLKGNHVEKTDGHGIAVVDSGVSEALAQNTVKNTGGNGILVQNSYCPVTGNEISSTEKAGILLYQCRGDNKRLNASDNIISFAGNVGIQLNASTKADITDNTVKDSAVFGIQLADSSDSVIRNNKVTGSQKIGIVIGNSTKAVLEYNDSTGNISRDIHVYNNSTGRAKGNTVGSAGWYVYDKEKFIVE